MNPAIWVDASALGVVFGRQRDAQGRVRLAAVDLRSQWSEPLAALGFEREANAADGLWLLRVGQSASPKALAASLGSGVKQVELEPDAIARAYLHARELRIYTANRERMLEQRMSAGSNDHPITTQKLGTNYAGASVYVADGVRLFEFKDQSSGKTITVRETDASSKGGTRRGSHAAAFLYADSLDDLGRVADGFVARVLAGERLKLADFDLMASACGAGDGGAFSRRDLEEAVEGAVGRCFARHAQKNRDPEFGHALAVRLLDSLPAQRERTSSSVANQQYSTPWPLSFQAQRLLGNTAGFTVLEPTIGNRSLVSALEFGSFVYGAEIDSKRLSYFGKGVADNAIVHVADATEVDFHALFGESAGFDRTIANPPFGSLDRVRNVSVTSPLVQSGKLQTQRLDHLILLRALAARKDAGRSVFIVGADQAIDDGVVLGRTKHLMNYLYDHYEVEGAVDVSGRIFQRMGATYPTRLLVIGNKKSNPEHSGDAPESLRVLKSHDELKSWVDGVLERRHTPVQKSDELAVVASVTEEKMAPVEGVVISQGTASTPPVTAADESLLVSEEGAAPSEPFVSEADQIEQQLEAQAEVDAQVVTDNFQRTYQPFSKVGIATTMIPVNLASAVYEALTSVQQRFGEIDEFVATELEYSVPELGRYFSPEQVDALALAIAAKKEGNGFLLGDYMGVGKGRTLAAMARHARLNGETPVFITYKPNLFSDFLERDVADIGSRALFKQPFLFNADAKVVDGSGNVTARGLKTSEYQRCYEQARLPEGTDIVFLTYSQLARSESASARAKFFQDLATVGGLSLLLDESHNAAGESYTGQNIAKAIANNDGSVIYSSGTPIKGVKNLAVYSAVLPRGINHEELLSVVSKDPLAMQEALNNEIALRGCLVSRELDNRDLEKNYVVSGHVERNRQLVDQVSEILMAMSYLSGDVNNIVKERDREIRKLLKALPDSERVGSRMSVSSMNFGSRFHALTRQFLLAVKADDVVDEVLTALANDEKPIVALQHTGETLLANAVWKVKTEKAIKGAAIDAEDEAVKLSIGKGVMLNDPVTFKDLLIDYVGRILQIKEQSHYGEVSYRSAKGEAVEDSVKHIKNLIAKLPTNLPLTPIDYLTDKLERAGYKVGEITGRSLRARYLDVGVMVEPVSNTDKTRINKTCRDFNNGALDVVVLTASGSTGNSLQSSPALGKDTRRRHMIKWEPQQDIAVERQIDGRPNRNGQVNKPRYSVMLSGLLADDRQAMMFNNKNRSLTAATTANRDSKELIRNVPDLLNAVGDEVAYGLLLSDPKLAELFDVSLDPEEDNRRASLYYINRMTGRIMLLPHERQEALYKELDRRFKERIEELSARGENPLEVKCHDWRARIIDRKLITGSENKNSKSKSQFDAPVYATTLAYEIDVKPIRLDALREKIAIGRALLSEHKLVGQSGSVREVVDMIRGNAGQWLKDSVSVYKFPSGSVHEALHAKEPNETQTLKAKLDWLHERLPHVAPGNVFYQNNDLGEEGAYAVVSLSLPGAQDDFKRLGMYSVAVVRAGEDKVEHMSLNELFVRQARITGGTLEANKAVQKAFESAPEGQRTVQRMVMDGNIFEAVALAMRHQLGSKIMYTDDKGIRQHGVALNGKLSIDKLLTNIPERFKSPMEAMLYLDAQAAQGTSWIGVSSDSNGKYNNPDAVRLSKTDAGDYVITVPGTKSGGGHVFLDERLAKIEGNKASKDGFGLDFSGTRAAMRAYVPARDAEAVVRFLMDVKSIAFYTLDKEGVAAAREQAAQRDAQRAQSAALAA